MIDELFDRYLKQENRELKKRIAALDFNKKWRRGRVSDNPPNKYWVELTKVETQIRIAIAIGSVLLGKYWEHIITFIKGLGKQ